jgi:hypothetical protein
MIVVVILIILAMFLRSNSYYHRVNARVLASWGIISKPWQRKSTSRTLSPADNKSEGNVIDSILSDDQSVSENVYFGAKALAYMNFQVKYDKSPLLDPILFANYVRKKVARKLQNDKNFIHMIEIREIRRNNAALLEEAETKMINSKNALASHPNYSELTILDKDIAGGAQAIASIEKLIEKTGSLEKNITNISISDNILGSESSTIESRSDQLTSLATAAAQTNTTTQKTASHDKIIPEDKLRRLKEVLLPQKLTQVKANNQRREELRNQTPEYKAYHESIRQVNSLYESIGLFTAIETSTMTQIGSGTKIKDVGKGFEEASFTIVQKYLVPYLSSMHSISIDDIFLLTNVKFGFASSKGSTGEFDCIVCAKTNFPQRFQNFKTKGSFCKVLGVVEVTLIHSTYVHRHSKHDDACALR